VRHEARQSTRLLGLRQELGPVLKTNHQHDHDTSERARWPDA
jgi:hypothetical protein